MNAPANTAPKGISGTGEEQSFLPLSRPSISVDDVEAVGDVLRSGWITTGAVCAEFESAFAARMDCAKAVALTSGTAGLHLLLHALGIGPGDEVITPSMTWVSTVNMITLAGATPVFVDVDRDTLLIDTERVREAITDRTRLIIPVHFAGAACDLEPLRRLARDHHIFLAEDAAHAAGAAYRQRPVGHGGTAIFSLHPIKNLTSGEGGVLCTNDEDLASRIRRLRLHGLGADAYERDMQGRAPRAEVLEPGYKYNLPDMNAALALSQLTRLEEMNERRARLASYYTHLLTDVEEVRPLAIPEYPMRHAWHLYVIRLDAERLGMDRETFILELKQQNIGTGIHFLAAHQHAYYRDRVALRFELPNTEWNSERVCSLPLFPDMGRRGVMRVVNAIRNVLGRRRR